MDKHDIPAPATQAEVSPESDELFWHRPCQGQLSRASAKIRRSGASWWFRQMHKAVDVSTSHQPSPGTEAPRSHNTVTEQEVGEVEPCDCGECRGRILRDLLKVASTLTAAECDALGHKSGLLHWANQVHIKKHTLNLILAGAVKVTGMSKQGRPEIDFKSADLERAREILGTE